MDTKRYQIVRALWGDYNKLVKEIPTSPIFDEVVFVWGNINFNYLSSLGYRCIKMSSDSMQSYSSDEMYFLKPLAWQKACEMFGSILFLDWDVRLVKPLDDKFWSGFGNTRFSAPLYSYPIGLENQSKILPNNIQVWVDVLGEYLYDYSWKWNNFSVLPNAGLVFLDGVETANDIVNIIKENNLKGLTEEFALFKLADCDIKTYLHTYEPKSIFGRPDFHYFNIGEFTGYIFKKLNEYISTEVKKDVYLVHD